MSRFPYKKVSNFPYTKCLELPTDKPLVFWYNGIYERQELFRGRPYDKPFADDRVRSDALPAPAARLWGEGGNHRIRKIVPYP
jgi:hypothetical protein